MTGAFAREFIRNTYQEDRLISDRWVIRGETVRLSAIACPTLAVTCEGDFITPRAAASPLVEIVAGARETVLQTGHIGVVVGSEGPKTFYPLVDRFFRGVA
jgi:poly(3-hydroxyalkanoate) synthetase